MKSDNNSSSYKLNYAVDLGLPTSRPNVARAMAKTEEELEQDIAEDADWRDIPKDWFKDAKLIVPES